MTTPETVEVHEGLPVIAFANPDALDAWLDEHGEEASGVWMKIAKAATGIPSITWAQAVDVALCHGWIDGKAQRIDDTWYRQRLTPRRPRSVWSKRNRDNVERLIAEGKMRPAGLRQVEAAKADGRWDAAYDGPATATVPDDLQAALDASPSAAAAFAALNSQNRYAILHRLMSAKKPETRQRRLEKFVAMLEADETIY